MFSVREAAKKLGISRSKLYELVERREVSYFRVGGKILFEESDLRAFLDTCRVAAEPKQAAQTPAARQKTLRRLTLD